LAELEHVPEKNEREIAELTVREEKLSKDLEKEKAGVEKAMAGLKAETQELQDSKEQLQAQLIGLKKTVDETKSVVSYSSLHTKLTPWPESVSELNRLSYRCLSAKLVATFAYGGVSCSLQSGSPAAVISIF
jgi:structural maintenance of chromosome 4